MERHKLKVAVYVMLIKGGSILLARRYQTGWMDGKYTLPSGHLDPNEAVAGAAIRETQEEVGVTLAPEDIHIVHTMHRMNIYIDFYFKADKWEGEPKNMELDKCDEVQWFPIDQLPENMVPSVRHAIEQYQKGVAFSEFENEG
jgi:8-oxo-dGTP diphosphatase